MISYQRAVELFPREDERLIVLERTGLLDTPPEDEYDWITEQAKQALDVPIALVSLVDRDRQWFKSCAGDLPTRETPRDVAFCSHTILSDQPLIVLDTTQDERFKNNALVCNPPHIKFYAGAPIIVPDGLMLGTLCVVDSQPRLNFSPDKVAILVTLANEVSKLVQEKLSRGSKL